MHDRKESHAFLQTLLLRVYLMSILSRNMMTPRRFHVTSDDFSSCHLSKIARVQA